MSVLYFLNLDLLLPNFRPMMMIRIGACLGLAVVAQGLNSKELYHTHARSLFQRSLICSLSCPLPTLLLLSPALFLRFSYFLLPCSYASLSFLLSSSLQHGR